MLFITPHPHSGKYNHFGTLRTFLLFNIPLVISVPLFPSGVEVRELERLDGFVAFSSPFASVVADFTRID